MNRHQSNPFLAGWEESDSANSQIATVNNTSVTPFDENSISNSEQSGEFTSRRYSSSNAEVSGNPFGAQRSADRRLYHRNMSSFEAASLTLEQHQQMQDNATSNLSKGQTELIAKMTADFQSAIETNDKEFAFNAEGLQDGVDMNTFDPFETIVDDDISLQSPAIQNRTEQTGKFVLPVRKNSELSPAEIVPDNPPDLDDTSNDRKSTKNVHDSIDDDEEDLVSTPVRNIKAPPLNKLSFDHNDGASDERVDELTDKLKRFNSKEPVNGNRQSSESKDFDSANSIEKASLFASLLATAESSGQPSNSSNLNPSECFNSDEENLDHKPEGASHVIKGGQSMNSGNLDRPVGFFDPFETVIDKDALTSLMNDSQPPSQNTIEDVRESYTETAAAASVTLSKCDVDEGGIETPCPVDDYNDFRSESSRVVESVSIETVVEHSSKQPNSQEVDTAETSTMAEPTSADHGNPKQSGGSDAIPCSTLPVNSLARPTAAKKSAKPKKKSSFQEDSSDDSDEDDRIQIVIKARNPGLEQGTAAPALVPLLPPPPSKHSMKQARERGHVDDMPSPVMNYRAKREKKSHDHGLNKKDGFEESESESDEVLDRKGTCEVVTETFTKTEESDQNDEDNEKLDDGGQFVIPMTHSDDEGDYNKPDTPLYDEDTSYVLEEYPTKYEGPGWDMMLRYPPKKKLTSNRFWKRIFVKLAQVPVALDAKSAKQSQETTEPQQFCIALQIYDKPDDKKPMQEIPIQATYTVSEISSQQFDQFGKIFTIKLQYIFYKERVGVRQGQLARFMHSGHIGSSTTSGGHGVDPISIGSIKRMGAPIEHSPQISQIIKLGCTSYNDIKVFKTCLEDHLFKMPIHRDRALSTYRTEEVQMAVRDETYIELNQVGTIVKQLARVRLFFLSFLNGMPTVEVGINDIHRQGREVVGRMDILPVVTEEWIRLEAWELNSTAEKEAFENPDSRIIKLIPPDATFFELMRFRIRPPRNRELPLQISANMSVTRTKVSINCEVMVPGCVSRKHGQIPCEGIAIRVHIPECWIYFFREEKHFRMGSKKSVNRRPGKVKGIERFLGGGGLQDINDESSLIEVTSGQAKYEHHHHSIVWRATRWPKESQSAYVQNTMKIRLPLTAYDQMPDSLYEYVHVEYSMPATTVSHTTLRSISVNPCEDEPPEKYVKYSAKYEYKVKMRLSVNLGSKPGESQPEASPIVIMKQPDLQGDLQPEKENDDSSDDDSET